MGVVLELPWRRGRNAAVAPPPPQAVVAASNAYQWAGATYEVEGLQRLRQNWYPHVQRYLREIGIFAAAARDTAQTIAELDWSADDKLFGQRPSKSDSQAWGRLAESVSTLDWYRAAHQIYGVGAVHIVAWPDRETLLRFQVCSLTELTPPLSGHRDAAPMLKRHDADIEHPLWEPGTPPNLRPRIVTCYRPDGEYGQMVWCPAQGLIDDFEALVLMSVADKAYDLHRASGAGILYIPNSIAQLKVLPSGEAQSALESPSVRSIVKMIMEPLSNPQHPNRVIPAVLTGPDDAGDRIKHILLERPGSDAYEARRNARWRNIALALDQPAGRVLNSEDTSKFYNAQQLDFMSMRATVGLAKVLSDGLMRDLFHPVMREQWGDKHWRRRTLSPSWDHLQPEPDRTDEAIRLLEAGVVTLGHAQEMAKIPEAGRIELGSPEWRSLLEWRQALNPGLAPTPTVTGDPLGAATPPSAGPAAPGTAPDGAGAPDPLAGFDATLASARFAAMQSDMAKIAAQRDAKTAAGQDHSGGVMVSLTIPPDVARTIAVPGGEPADDLHVTIAYLGKTDNPYLVRAEIEAALAKVTWEPRGLDGTIGGIGRFPGSHIEGLQAVWVPVDVPGLVELRSRILEAIASVDIEQGSEHGYTPHVTLDYVTAEQPSPPPVPSINVGWTSFAFSWGGERVEFPFVATPSDAKTAAATDPHPLAPAADTLNRIDADLRAKLAGACETAMRSTMRKVGVKVAAKARADTKRATADLASSPWLIPERLGPSVVAAVLADDDPIAGSFDDLGDQADGWMDEAVVAALLALGIKRGSETFVAATGRAATQRASATALLRDSMESLARARIYTPGTTETRGEPVSGLVPAGIPGRVIAVAGGARTEIVDGAARLAASDAPVGGLATGPLVLETVATLDVPPLRALYTWRTGNPEHPFKPHHDLDGVTVTSTTDARLASTAEGEWLSVSHYRPLDHSGCRCWWQLGFEVAQ